MVFIRPFAPRRSVPQHHGHPGVHRREGRGRASHQHDLPELHCGRQRDPHRGHQPLHRHQHGGVHVPQEARAAPRPSRKRTSQKRGS